MPPTLDDVARRAGVHKGTASRALNAATRSQVNGETAKRVLAAARALGYTPNAMARALRTARTQTVGILLPDLTNPLFPPIVRGVEDVLGRHGYTALLANTDNSPDKARTAFDALLARQVDGFIVATARREDPVVRDALAAGLRVVLVNRTTEKGHVSAVAGDDTAGISQVVDHLVGLGHRHIGHVAGPEATSTGMERRFAFEQAMRRHRLTLGPHAIVEAGGYSEIDGATAARHLFDADPQTTAVVAANDLIALGVLQVLTERGRACPLDVSVVGYNDMPFLDKLATPLTSVRIPHYELGAQSAQLLLDQLGPLPHQPRTILLPSQLIVRSSTAPPNGTRQ
jgi:LacI family transcriptional regulator